MLVSFFFESKKEKIFSPKPAKEAQKIKFQQFFFKNLEVVEVCQSKIIKSVQKIYQNLQLKSHILIKTQRTGSAVR